RNVTPSRAGRPLSPYALVNLELRVSLDQLSAAHLTLALRLVARAPSRCPFPPSLRSAPARAGGDSASTAARAAPRGADGVLASRLLGHRLSAERNWVSEAGETEMPSSQPWASCWWFFRLFSRSAFTNATSSALSGSAARASSRPIKPPRRTWSGC